jgi:hypothetical protein
MQFESDPIIYVYMLMCTNVKKLWNIWAYHPTRRIFYDYSGGKYEDMPENWDCNIQASIYVKLSGKYWVLDAKQFQIEIKLEHFQRIHAKIVELNSYRHIRETWSELRGTPICFNYHYDFKKTPFTLQKHYYNFHTQCLVRITLPGSIIEYIMMGDSYISTLKKSEYQLPAVNYLLERNQAICLYNMWKDNNNLAYNLDKLKIVESFSKVHDKHACIPFIFGNKQGYLSVKYLVKKISYLFFYEHISKSLMTNNLDSIIMNNFYKFDDKRIVQYGYKRSLKNIMLHFNDNCVYHAIESAKNVIRGKVESFGLCGMLENINITKTHDKLFNEFCANKRGIWDFNKNWSTEDSYESHELMQIKIVDRYEISPKVLKYLKLGLLHNFYLQKYCAYCAKPAQLLCDCCKTAFYCSQTCKSADVGHARKITFVCKCGTPTNYRCLACADTNVCRNCWLDHGCKKRCNFCCEPAHKVCQSCLLGRYCSKSCQAHDWSHHKKICGKQFQKKFIYL